MHRTLWAVALAVAVACGATASSGDLRQQRERVLQAGADPHTRDRGQPVHAGQVELAPCCSSSRACRRAGSSPATRATASARAGPTNIPDLHRGTGGSAAPATRRRCSTPCSTPPSSGTGGGRSQGPGQGSGAGRRRDEQHPHASSTRSRACRNTSSASSGVPRRDRPVTFDNMAWRSRCSRRRLVTPHARSTGSSGRRGRGGRPAEAAWHRSWTRGARPATVA